MRLSHSDMKWLSSYEGYHYAVNNSGRYADTLDLMRKCVRPGSVVIDLGMYPGHLALLAKRYLHAQMTGLSFAHSSSFERQMAKEGIRIVETDISEGDLPFEEQSFDAAICTEIIEHLDRPLDLLMKANHLLKPGGILILSTPNHASLKNRVNLLIGKPTNQHLFGVEHAYQMNEWVHKREYTSGELRRLLEPVGFDIEEVRYTKLEHPADSLRTVLTHLLKGVLYMKQSFKGGIILAARKVRSAEYTSAVPHALRSSIRASVDSIRTKPGHEISLEIVATNTGDTTWLRENNSGYGFVQTGAHLLEGDSLVDYDFLRHPLPANLAPGESVSMELRFHAPKRTGEFIIELDMVNEGISWFKDSGSRTTMVRLVVEE